MIDSCSVDPYCSANHLHYIQVRVLDIATVLIHVHTLDNDSMRGLRCNKDATVRGIRQLTKINADRQCLVGVSHIRI